MLALAFLTAVFVCFFIYIFFESSPAELQFYTSAAAIIMLIPAWVFLMVRIHGLS